METKTPETRAREVCAEFLAGSWSKVDPHKITVVKLADSLSNHLYACSLSDDVETSEDEPKQVVVRRYGARGLTAGDPSAITMETVAFALLGERGLGPVLYGVYDEGRIEQFLPNTRQLTYDEQRDDKLAAKVARNMYKFHTMKMPTPKTKTWVYDTILKYISLIEKLSYTGDKGEKLNKLKAIGLRDELQSMRDIMKEIDSPLVFCHNDLHGANVLYEEKTGNLTLVDYEYSRYNFRGYDITNHFIEWCINYVHPDPPYFQFTSKHFPNREKQLSYIRAYLEGANLSPDAQSREEVAILKEIRYYRLPSHFFWALCSTVQGSMSDYQDFGYIDYSLRRFEEYFKIKAELQQEQ